MNILIGHTGFVGGTLSRQFHFDESFNSANINSLRGKHVSLIVCAGVAAQKWIANRDPENDWAKIQSLIDVLKTVQTERFILISTVDVYATPNDCDEETIIPINKEQHYGRHRLQFEEFIRGQFPHALIVRLPALFGQGLKKNVIYDLINNNCLENINVHNSFQWYDMSRLWNDITTADNSEIKLVNLVTEPIETSEIVDSWFKGKVENSHKVSNAKYNIKTKYASTFGGMNGYIQGKNQILSSLNEYLLHESVTK